MAPRPSSDPDRPVPVITWAGGAPIRRAPVALARRFLQICTAVVAETLREEDLTPLQFAVLANLGGPDVDQIGLAARIGVDRNTVGVLVDQLESRGLIKRRVDGPPLRARLRQSPSPSRRLPKRAPPRA